jgi:serine phosphatase RsbU (regulator of sigma subunit)/pSer/pThr/pTyr-binding forkhead associated (FHA) protein
MTVARIETEENGQRKSYPLKDKFSIGRKPQNDLIFNLGDVSREHAVIEAAGDKFVIKDLGSRFGTFVNDKRIEASTLVHGDRVRIGSSPQTQFVFKLGDTTGGGKDRTTQTSSISAPIIGDLRQVTLLLDGLRAMGSGRVLEEVLAIVLDSAIDLAGAERGFVMLANAKDQLEFKLARGRGGKTLLAEGVVTSHSIPEQVFKDGVALVREDLLDASLKGKHDQTLVAGIRAAICVPLRLAMGDAAFPTPADVRTIGVLYVDSSQRAGFISPATRAALEAVADQAALAIQNARLFKESAEKQRMEQDLKRAAEVQLSLLPPRLHTSGPLEVAGNTLPCRSVGGDFFDYFDAAGNLFVFAVADVSGKGMPAALLAAQTQGIFSTRAEVMESPALVMAQVNRTLSRRSTRGFVTMACAVMDGSGGLITCNAGHNPPLVLRSDGKIDILEEGGLMLGPFENATFNEQSTTLGPGDLVVIYSDGVTECTDQSGEFFGEERVYECLRDCTKLSANAVLERVFRAVSEFSGDAPQADDITVLVVRFMPVP